MSTLDDYLQLLANPHRRRLLRSLHNDEDGSVTVQRDDQNAYHHLYHVHLPKLENAGLIDWNPRQRTVVPGPAFDDIVPLLEALDEVVSENEELREAGEKREDGEGNEKRN